jgi:hypothetical protein
MRHAPTIRAQKKMIPRCTQTRIDRAGRLNDWQPRVSRFPETSLGASILRQASRKAWCCCCCWQGKVNPPKATTDGTFTCCPGWTTRQTPKYEALCRLVNPYAGRKRAGRLHLCLVNWQPSPQVQRSHLKVRACSVLLCALERCFFLDHDGLITVSATSGCAHR